MVEPDQSSSVDYAALVQALAKALALASVALYAAGFLIVNAHLSKFGFFDYSIANPRFMLAGGVCAFFGICWYHFSARKIIQGPDDLLFVINLLEKQKAAKAWSFVAFVDSVTINPIFGVCAASTLFSFFFFSAGTPNIAAAGLILYMVVYFATDSMDVDLKSPRVFLLIDVAMKMLFLAAFVFAVIQESLIGILAAIYYGMSQVINALLHQFERMRLGSVSMISIVAYTAMVIVLSIISFGYLLFGSVQARFGGGAPIEASLILRSDLGSENRKAGKSIDTNILYLSDRSVLFDDDGRPTLVDLKDISSIAFKPKSEKLPFEGIWKAFDQKPKTGS